MELCDTVCLSDEVISDTHIPKANNAPTLAELPNIQQIPSVIIYGSDFAYNMALHDFIKLSFYVDIGRFVSNL